MISFSFLGDTNILNIKCWVIVTNLHALVENSVVSDYFHLFAVMLRLAAVLLLMYIDHCHLLDTSCQSRSCIVWLVPNRLVYLSWPPDRHVYTSYDAQVLSKIAWLCQCLSGSLYILSFWHNWHFLLSGFRGLFQILSLLKFLLYQPNRLISTQHWRKKYQD